MNIRLANALLLGALLTAAFRPVRADGPDAAELPVARAAYVWPDWSRTARIAGAFFDLTDTSATIDARLDALAAQHVSVVLADCPWGWSYAAWVDDAEFFAIQRLVATVVQKAHARGLKVVIYQTGLELISKADRNPGPEHPDWAQVALDGRPILFNDIANEDEHWLEPGEWDLWLSPCGSYRAFSLGRTREVAKTGIDGLWIDTVYLQHSIGQHGDLWPSADACSAAAFQAAAGLTMPAAENWDDPTWRRWIVWRHAQMVDYLLALKQAAREINPSLVCFEENWNCDTAGATYYANDPADYVAQPDMSTGHEIATIGDRVDLGAHGMQDATLDQWLAFRTMVAFARGADRDKPSWVLTYGYQPRDSAQLAGLVLAEGASFYETRGPGMADSVGAAHRTQLFAWIAAHSADLYGGAPAADVAILYSPRTRDLRDGGSGDFYDLQDSTHFAAYRGVANALHRAHVPFAVVIDTDTSAFGRYAVLIAPEVQAMSNATADALKVFAGKIINLGDSGAADEWMTLRPANALEGVAQEHFTTATAALVASADTGLLATNAPASLQIGVRQTPAGYALVLVNTAAAAAGAFAIDLRLRSGETVAAARLSRLEGGDSDVPTELPQAGVVRFNVPAGIDAVALLSVRIAGRRTSAGRFGRYR